ncbi:MAG: hypothetical protein DSY77_08595 [Bacteroidetes bacterium]|nr:MAG: hypothetical protein DSY77_08595 [Bacteroidota bacterium]
MRDTSNFIISALVNCLLLTFIYVLFTGCGGNYSSQHTYQINVDTVKFKISAEFLDYYAIYDILDEENLFVGYNHFNHSLQFIDLHSKETKQTIKLERDGPSRIKTLSELLLLEDKIYLKTVPEWITIDHNGKVLERVNYSNLAEDLNNEYIIGGGFTISYTIKRELSIDQKSVYMRLYPVNLEANTPEFYTAPLFCKLNFDTKSVEIDPFLPYPELFRSGINYGILDKPSIIELEDRLVYSFPNHSTIYVYDLKDSSISANMVKSKKIDSVVDINQNGTLRDVMKSSLLGDTYHPIIYDKFRDLYYRVIRVIDETKDEKEYYLQIINNEFKVLEEIELPDDKVYQNRYEVTREGLYFQLMSSRGNIFSYMLVDVQVEQ